MNKTGAQWSLLWVGGLSDTQIETKTNMRSPKLKFRWMNKHPSSRIFKYSFTKQAKISHCAVIKGYLQLPAAEACCSFYAFGVLGMIGISHCEIPSLQLVSFRHPILSAFSHFGFDSLVWPFFLVYRAQEAWRVCKWIFATKHSF